VEGYCPSCKDTTLIKIVNVGIGSYDFGSCSCVHYIPEAVCSKCGEIPQISESNETIITVGMVENEKYNIY